MLNLIGRKTREKVVDLYGESNWSSGFLDRHTATPDIHIAALLRTILYSDDSSYHLDPYPRFDHITTPEDEHKKISAIESPVSFEDDGIVPL